MRTNWKKHQLRKHSRLGFTLVEVLVAIAILAILAVPLAQMMITSSQINSQSKNVGSASDMAQTVAESMQATQLGNVLTEINGYQTDSVGQNLFDVATGEGYSFLNNALKGYSIEDSYEVMLLCPNCNTRLSSQSIEDKLCEKCNVLISQENIKYVPVTKQNDVGVQSDADVTSSIKTRTTTENVVRTYFTGNTDDTYDFVLKNIATEEANFDVLVHVEPQQSLQIANISSMSSSDLVNIVEKKNLDEDVAETFFAAHQMYCTLKHTSTSMTVQDFENQMTRHITIDIRNDAIRGTTVITIKAEYTAPDGTVDTPDKYITKTIGSFTTNSTAELAEGVYFYYYPLHGVSRDVITVNNPDSMGIKVYLIVMNDSETGEYHPTLEFSDLTPANAANTTVFCSNLPSDEFAELPTGVKVQTLSNTTEQQTLYSMDVKVFTHKDSSFSEDGAFIPNEKYLIVDTDATLLDSSEKFDINVDSEFGNPIPEEPEGGEPGADPGEGDDDIVPAPNKGYSEAGGQNFTYSGDEYDVTIVGGLPGGEEAGKYIEWSGQTKATDAGVYFAYAKPVSGHTWPNGTTGKRQITWTIARKPASIITPQSVIYDSFEHLGYDPNTDKTNYVTITGETNKTNAGYYTLYVTPEPNYSWLDDGSYTTREVTWTISPKAVILTWKTGLNLDTWQYDGNEHFGQCEVAPESLAPADRGLVLPNIRNNRIIEVGKITAEVTSLNNSNYALPTQGTTHDLTVWGAKQAEVVMNPAYNGVVSTIYNGKEQTGVAFSTGVAITGTSHAINAGTYIITATPLPGYAWDVNGNDKAPRDFEWQILQKDVAIKWGTLEWDYDGVTHSTTCEITNLIPDTICEVEIANNFILDAGSKEVQATLTNKNYKFPDISPRGQEPQQTLVVHPLKDATYTVNGVVTYDGQTHNWGTGTHIQITGTLSETEAGKYQVTITPTKNHTWANGSTDAKTETWTIAQAELSTVDWDNYAFTGDIIVGVTNQFCDWGEGNWKATNKGTYTIQVTPSKNYAWANDPDEVVYTYKPQDTSTRTYTWKIVGNNAVKPDPNKAILNFGDPILTFEYNGKIRSPHISTIDGTLPLTDPVFTKNPYYTVTGTIKATDVGNYTAVISLKDKTTTEWASGGTDDIVINWSITKRKITLHTISHEGLQSYYDRDAFDAFNDKTTVPTAYRKTWDGKTFTSKLKLKLASSETATDGDVWLTKDEFIEYQYDYMANVTEKTPLAESQKITFAFGTTENLRNPNTGTKKVDQQTDAGIYVYSVVPTIYDAGNRNVTHNYEITYDFTHLMIDKEAPGYEVRLAQNARTYNGKVQNLLTIVQAPEGGELEFLWEHIGYKATAFYSATSILEGKTSRLPNVSTGFNKTTTDDNFMANKIESLVGAIDNTTQAVIRDSSPMWTNVIPNGTVESKGTTYTNLGTEAGKYIVYYRIHGDKNHEDYWDSSMFVVIDVQQAKQSIFVDNTFDKCHNGVESTVTYRMQEDPKVSYAWDTSYIKTPTTSSNTATGTHVSSQTNAVGSQKVVTMKSNGRVGETTITIEAAATANYRAGKDTIKVYCRDHLKDNVVRDALDHHSSSGCSLGTHSPGTYKETCTTSGNDHYDCLECGSCRNKNRPKLGHAVSTSGYGGPWCTNDRGYHYSCTRSGCNYSGTVSYGAPYGAHNYEDWNALAEYHYRRCMNVLGTRTVYWTDSNGVTHSAQVPSVRCLYSDGNKPHSPWTWSYSGCCYQRKDCYTCGANRWSGNASHYHSTYTTSSTYGKYTYTYTYCHCGKYKGYSKTYNIWG